MKFFPGNYRDMKSHQATIRDIAIKLNLSISTVSRALRNAPDINPETKQLVEEMAKKLHYEPNKVAQSLRSNKTNTIGVIVPEIAMHFFSSVLSGIQDYATDQNCQVMICQSAEHFKTEKLNLQMLVSHRVDGLLISLSSQTKDLEHVRTVVSKKIPVVLFDRISEEIDTSKVIVDDFQGAFTAVEYLIKTGCKRIAYLGGSKNLLICTHRKNGYIKALEKYDIKVNPEYIIHSTTTEKDISEAVIKLLQLPSPPDAVFCMNDPIAIGVIQSLKAEGVRIPDEISVIGFTNEPVSAYIEPSLTTVAQPAYEMGKTACKLLFEQINKKGEAPITTKVIKTELIIRNSTRKI